jgi:TP53 regulating kinase and related kinases
MVKIRKEGVPIPGLIFVDTISSSLYMEHINPSISLKQFLVSAVSIPSSLLNDLCSQIGKSIAMIHNVSCIHGDLTTSNMLLKPQFSLNSELEFENNVQAYINNPCIVYIIDFGLSYGSSATEDMAVDLHVLEKAISSAHPLLETFV